MQSSNLEDFNESEQDFQKLCAPLVEYIQKKCNPHTKIIIQWDGAQLTQDKISCPFEVPD